MFLFFLSDADIRFWEWFRLIYIIKYWKDSFYFFGLKFGCYGSFVTFTSGKNSRNWLRHYLFMQTYSIRVFGTHRSRKHYLPGYTSTKISKYLKQYAMGTTLRLHSNDFTQCLTDTPWTKSYFAGFRNEQIMLKQCPKRSEPIVSYWTASIRFAFLKIPRRPKSRAGDTYYWVTVLRVYWVGTTCLRLFMERRR